MDLIAIVFDFGEGDVFVHPDFDRLRQGMLAAQHHGMFDRDVQIASALLRRMRPGGLQQIGHDLVDPRNLLPDVLYHRACGTGRGKVSSNDFDDSRNSGQRIPDFVGQARG